MKDFKIGDVVTVSLYNDRSYNSECSTVVEILSPSRYKVYLHERAQGSDYTFECFSNNLSSADHFKCSETQDPIDVIKITNDMNLILDFLKVKIFDKTFNLYAENNFSYYIKGAEGNFKVLPKREYTVVRFSESPEEFI